MKKKKSLGRPEEGPGRLSWLVLTVLRRHEGPMDAYAIWKEVLVVSTRHWGVTAVRQVIIRMGEDRRHVSKCVEDLSARGLLERAGTAPARCKGPDKVLWQISAAGRAQLPALIEDRIHREVDLTTLSPLALLCERCWVVEELSGREAVRTLLANTEARLQREVDTLRAELVTLVEASPWSRRMGLGFAIAEHGLMLASVQKWRQELEGEV